MALISDEVREELLQRDPARPYVAMRITDSGRVMYWGVEHAFSKWVDDLKWAKRYKQVGWAERRAGAAGYVIDLREEFSLSAAQKERDAAAVERLKLLTE